MFPTEQAKWNQHEQCSIPTPFGRCLLASTMCRGDPLLIGLNDLSPPSFPFTVSGSNLSLNVCVHALSSVFKPAIVVFNCLIRSPTNSSGGTGALFLRFFALLGPEEADSSVIPAAPLSKSSSMVSRGSASWGSWYPSPGNPKISSRSCPPSASGADILMQKERAGKKNGCCF